MFYHVADTINKLDAFEKSADPEVLAGMQDLLKEIRWHLEDMHLSVCVQEAAYQLEDMFGYDNPSRELLEEAVNALYFSDNFIGGENAYEIVSEVVDKRGLLLEDLLEENEVIAKYASSASPVLYQCIMPENGNDLGNALEDTLHRILEMGDEKDVRRILGAYVPDAEEMEALEESGEYASLDLGYIIPGYIVSLIRPEPAKKSEA